MIEHRILNHQDEQLLVDAVLLFENTKLSAAEARFHLTDATQVYAVARCEGVIAGFLYGYVLCRFSKKVLFIYSVEVAADAGRQGIASGMIAALKEKGRSGAWQEMFVLTNSSNEAAMALYRRAGGERPNPDDVLFDFVL